MFNVEPSAQITGKDRLFPTDSVLLVDGVEIPVSADVSIVVTHSIRAAMRIIEIRLVNIATPF